MMTALLERSGSEEGAVQGGEGAAQGDEGGEGVAEPPKFLKMKPLRIGGVDVNVFNISFTGTVTVYAVYSCFYSILCGYCGSVYSCFYSACPVKLL
jgi:hypothetical protein